MNLDRSAMGRLMTVAVITVVWVSLSSSLFAFLVGGFLDGALSLLIAVAVVVAARSERVRTALATRPLNPWGTLAFAVVAISVIVFESGNLRFQSLTFMGELDPAALVRTIGAIGSILLSALLLWEVVRAYLQRG